MKNSLFTALPITMFVQITLVQIGGIVDNLVYGLTALTSCAVLGAFL